jgi:hypothetical protein
MKYHKDQLSKDSKYHEVVEKNGFVELVMIKPIWNGWKIVNNIKYKTSYWNLGIQRKYNI